MSVTTAPLPGGVAAWSDLVAPPRRHLRCGPIFPGHGGQPAAADPGSRRLARPRRAGSRTSSDHLPRERERMPPRRRRQQPVDRATGSSTRRPMDIARRRRSNPLVAGAPAGSQRREPPAREALPRSETHLHSRMMTHPRSATRAGSACAPAAGPVLCWSACGAGGSGGELTVPRVSGWGDPASVRSGGRSPPAVSSEDGARRARRIRVSRPATPTRDHETGPERGPCLLRLRPGRSRRRGGPGPPAPLCCRRSGSRQCPPPPRSAR